MPTSRGECSVVLGLPFVILPLSIPSPKFRQISLPLIVKGQELCSLPLLPPLYDPSFLLPLQSSGQSSNSNTFWRWKSEVLGERRTSQESSASCHDWKCRTPSQDRQRQHNLVSCCYVACATVSWLWKCRPDIQLLGRIQIGILHRVSWLF